MVINPESMPFKLGEVYGGFAEGHGMLIIERDGIKLEFQVQDAVLGVMKSQVKKIHIPFEEIRSVEYRKNWFISRFFIRLNSLESAQDFPIQKNGEIRLKVRRSDKALARSIASSIALQLSEFRLGEVDW